VVGKALLSFDREFENNVKSLPIINFQFFQSKYEQTLQRFDPDSRCTIVVDSRRKSMSLRKQH
jgi:hypothetical protein